MQKPTLPKGVRDFAPGILKQRQHIISIISTIYRKYGFEPLETPAMENLTTLTGKYGNEGDQLLFKILNNGDYLKGFDWNSPIEIDKLSAHIVDKGLRYDLTVPLARFVVQNQHLITFPFKRYQIQPVWRADRPQKGRYREFWQCDADVIGTDSLLCEADFIKIYNEVFNSLGLNNFNLRINHRSILEAIALTVDFHGPITDLTVAIDKLDKIGWEGVGKELQQKGFSENQVKKLQSLLNRVPLNHLTVDNLSNSLSDSPQKKAGIEALKTLIDLTGENALAQVSLDLSLARGLDYYTGVIFEAIIEDSGIGSVSGGGRYDNLTGMFGLNDVSGVGISFGLDRLHDIMSLKDLFESQDRPICQLLLCNFDEDSLVYCVQVADQLRDQGIAVEVYPEVKKIKKQLDYANKRNFRFVGLVGEEERERNVIQLKDMDNGTQESISIQNLIKRLG